MSKYDIGFAIMVDGELLMDNGMVALFTFQEALIKLRDLRIKHEDVRSLPYDPKWAA